MTGYQSFQNKNSLTLEWKKLANDLHSLLIFQQPLKQRFNYHLKSDLNIYKEEKLNKCSFLIDNLNALLLTELNKTFISTSHGGINVSILKSNIIPILGKKALKDVS